MNKLFTAALGLAVAVLPVLGVGVATADADLTCDAAEKLVVKAQARVDDRAASERVDENAALDKAEKVLDKAQDAVKDFVEGQAGKTLDELKAIRDNKKVLRDAARDALDTDSKRLAELRVLLTAAISDRDEACGEPTTTPPTPEPENDIDCDEVDGAEAQRILDADRNDPNFLDQDKDGIACEVDEVLDPPADDDSDAGSGDNVVTPAGGVNTGGWRK